jgi:hypothetical protein
VKTAEYGEIVDLARGRFRHRRGLHLERHHLSGVRVPNGDAIPRTARA